MAPVAPNEHAWLNFADYGEVGGVTTIGFDTIETAAGAIDRPIGMAVAGHDSSGYGISAIGSISAIGVSGET
jgi:hypothetical protein